MGTVILYIVNRVTMTFIVIQLNQNWMSGGTVNLIRLNMSLKLKTVTTNMTCIVTSIGLMRKKASMGKFVNDVTDPVKLIGSKTVWGVKMTTEKCDKCGGTGNDTLWVQLQISGTSVPWCPCKYCDGSGVTDWIRKCSGEKDQGAWGALLKRDR